MGDPRGLLAASLFKIGAAKKLQSGLWGAESDL